MKILIQEALGYTAVSAFGYYLIAKCGAAGFTFLWNFVARRQFLFVRRLTS
jgi:hypothetical protein